MALPDPAPDPGFHARERLDLVARTYVIKARRDVAEAWRAANPVLDLWEAGLELSADRSVVERVKVGDGRSAWNDLPYFVPSELA